jgi:hypothetical protein
VKGHKFGMVATCTRVKQNLIDLHQWPKIRHCYFTTDKNIRTV